MSSWFESIDLSSLQEQIKASVDHASKLVEEMNLDNMQQEQEAEEETSLFGGAVPIVATATAGSNDANTVAGLNDRMTPQRRHERNPSSSSRKSDKRGGKPPTSRNASKTRTSAKAKAVPVKAAPAPTENFGFFAGGAVWDDPLFASYEGPEEEDDSTSKSHAITDDSNADGPDRSVNGSIEEGTASATADASSGAVEGEEVNSPSGYEEEGEADDQGSVSSSGSGDSDDTRSSRRRYNFNEDFLKDISDCESEADIRDDAHRSMGSTEYSDEEEEGDGLEGTPSKHKGEPRSRSGSSASASGGASGGSSNSGGDITSQIWSNIRGLYSGSATTTAATTSSGASSAGASALNQPVRPRFLFFDRVEEEVDLEADPILKQVKKNASSGSYFDPSVVPKIFNDFLKPFKQPVQAPAAAEAAMKADVGGTPSKHRDIEIGSKSIALNNNSSNGATGTGSADGWEVFKQMALVVFTGCVAALSLTGRVLSPILGYLKALCVRLYLQVSTTVDSKGERINMQSRLQNIGWCTWSHVSSKNGIGTLMVLLILYSFVKFSSMALE